MDVSIIIINYNTCELTQQCLSSIYENTEGVSFEVIVVDNASSDNSIVSIKNNYPQVILIDSPLNLGFGKANNLGAKYASGKYLFLLNSDTILLDNIIVGFYEFMESNQSIVACGANLVDVNGKCLISHGKFPSLLQEFSDLGFRKYYSNYYQQKLSLGQTIKDGTCENVDYISGADIFMRKEIFDDLNGFDKDYFMYYEETDLFYRLYKRGLKSCLLPQYSLIHLEGGSFKNRGLNIKRFSMFLTSKLLFFRKNYSWVSYQFVKIASLLKIIRHFRIYKGHISKLIKLILNN